MGVRRRGRGWVVMGGLALAAATLPVAARPEDERPPAPVQVKVAFGDTVWSLARQHGDPHRDVRDVVTMMLRVNQVSPGDLQPGQVLAIPAGYAAPPGASASADP